MSNNAIGRTFRHTRDYNDRPCEPSGAPREYSIAGSYTNRLSDEEATMRVQDEIASFPPVFPTVQTKMVPSRKGRR